MAWLLFWLVLMKILPRNNWWAESGISCRVSYFHLLQPRPNFMHFMYCTPECNVLTFLIKH